MHEHAIDSALVAGIIRKPARLLGSVQEIIRRRVRLGGNRCEVPRRFLLLVSPEIKKGLTILDATICVGRHLAEVLRSVYGRNRHEALLELADIETAVLVPVSRIIGGILGKHRSSLKLGILLLCLARLCRRLLLSILPSLKVLLLLLKLQDRGQH